MLKSNPQRLAWITLLGALVVFFGMCMGVIAFTQWLLFESPTNLNVVLHVGQGTVGVAAPDSTDEKAVRSNTHVADDETLSTDTLSQGYLAFSDPYSGDLLATILLRNDSAATLRKANRPRFSFSDNPYLIRLNNINGRVEVRVNGGLHRALRIEIENALGSVYISEQGYYFIESTPDTLTVNVRSGTLTLVNAARQGQYLDEGKEAVITAATQAMAVTPGPIDLLPNWDFSQSEEKESLPPWPVGWSCAWDPSADNQDGPPGQYRFIKVDGRLTVNIWRMQPEPGPGTTRCVQYPGGPNGLDVTGYGSLRLRVTMQIHYSSLSACGVLGTECPVIIHVHYRDPDGNPFDWLHGFYADYTPNVGRRICDACLEPHEQINKDAWYTYESGNLFTDWPERQRPGIIDYIEFYADGHQYDVLLSEVALVATLPDGTASAAAN